ncbi:MAG: methyltransferase domain-containing protein [Tannerella sp.]|jgi:guanylate kinase/ubiquinone/menaquinone biosynthesis C-methylase UbiE|nr:methyltransferase domain-containing protein [Tannerella sp.]
MEKAYKQPFILVGGKSGIGKTEIVNKLISMNNYKYSRPISYTTRNRRENEVGNEYEFITEEEFELLNQQNKFVTVDKVYNYHYAMDIDSINKLSLTGIIPIKEIHPTNFNKIQKIYPNAITVLIYGKTKNSDTVRQEIDEEFYNSIDINNYDIVIENDFSKTIEFTAERLDKLINIIVETINLFPLPSVIDETNKIGYNKIAPEFTEEQRITTKNFHTYSRDFLENSITQHIKESDKILEIGPGKDWLQKNFKLPTTQYFSIDVSAQMLKEQLEENRYVGSVRNMPFPDNSFDVVISSLADPYFYPSAICDIHRVLKPNGKFIFTTPSSVWSNAIRNDNTNKTTFVLKSGDKSEVFSFTFTMPEIVEILKICNFEIINCEEIKAISEINEYISPAIISAAEKSNKSVSELVVLNAVICKK